MDTDNLIDLDNLDDPGMGNNQEMRKHRDKHRTFRARARERIEGIIDRAVKEAVEDDAAYQRNKPERLKEIDATLDNHFRHIFT